MRRPPRLPTGLHAIGALILTLLLIAGLAVTAIGVFLIASAAFGSHAI